VAFRTYDDRGGPVAVGTVAEVVGLCLGPGSAARRLDLVDSCVPSQRSGFAGLFAERLVPEFTMLSIDGQIMLNTTSGAMAPSARS
jgi:hypothetical protein